MRGQDKGSCQSQSSSSNESPKKNCFYALLCWCEKETSLDVLIGMLEDFSMYVYALIDPGATLS